MNKLNIYIRSYNELNKRELFDIYFLRQEVFIVEQNCVYQDIDQKDQYSYHLMAYDNEILVAYLLTSSLRVSNFFKLYDILSILL